MNRLRTVIHAASGASDKIDVVEHLLERDRAQRKDTRRVTKSLRREFDVTSRDSTDFADLLGQDQIRPKLAKQLRIDVIQAGAPMPVAGSRVNLFTRELARIDRDRVQDGLALDHLDRPVRVR